MTTGWAVPRVERVEPSLVALGARRVALAGQERDKAVRQEGEPRALVASKVEAAVAPRESAANKEARQA